MWHDVECIRSKIGRDLYWGLCSSIFLSLRTYRGADKEATLRSLARHAAIQVKLQEGSYRPTSLMQEQNESRSRSSKSSRQSTRTIAAMTIQKDKYNYLSQSEDKKKTGGCRFKRQNKNK